MKCLNLMAATVDTQLQFFKDIDFYSIDQWVNTLIKGAAIGRVRCLPDAVADTNQVWIWSLPIGLAGIGCDKLIRR